MRLAAFLLMTSAAYAEFATLDGQRVYYEVVGKGDPAVVLIHGWTCDTTFWKAQKDALAAKHRVIALDLPGHGRSDKPDQTYDLPLFARGVRAVMDAAKIKRAALVGHSMGSAVIQQFYVDTPERVAAIVSVDGAVLKNPSETLSKQMADFAASMRGPGGPDVRRKFIEGMFTEATTPDLRKHITSAMLAAPENVAASAMHNMFQSPIWRRTEKIAAPALAINRVNKQRNARAVHEQTFANLEYHELDNVSHFLQMEAPERFNPILLAFLAKLKQ